MRVSLAVVATLCLSMSTAHADDALDSQVRAAMSGPIQGGVWFGAPGASIYELGASQPLPTASVIKAAILVELFAAHAGHLDDPLGTDAVVADDAHAAMTPFSDAQRKDIRAALTGVTTRTIGAIMMGSHKASNHVYNAAANLAIASLGGPVELTKKIGARDPRFASIVVGRYMLAPRKPTDNLATPASLAAVLSSIATANIPNVDGDTAAAMTRVMLQSKDALGVRYHKDGNLDSDPIVVVKTGFYLRTGKPPLVYVVAAAMTAKPTGTRDAETHRLDKLTDAVVALLTKP
ncbi:MAG TPA: serine hydrolase [Kofleriaceae bacterium]|jgi:beta-lactamase class A|nr:serine hydrolase [Kofleriaceae bacterium]